jgi:hypothetical protein
LSFFVSHISVRRWAFTRRSFLLRSFSLRH